MKLSKEQIQELRLLKDTEYTTHRVTSQALEEILGEPIRVLDHGFIRVVDYMGNDSAIVQAARVSYGEGTKKRTDDVGLIRYLMRHRHTTPFEMCEIKFHVKLPMFVARQWIRHRTANVNEYSARYSILDKEFYVPDREHLAALKADKEQPDLFKIDIKSVAKQSETNKQGRDEILSQEEALECIKRIQSESARAYSTYSYLLNDKEDSNFDQKRKGLARELARMVLPVNYYTQWYWKVDLHNLLHFVSLRADHHAQYEIRAYAEQICDVLQKWVPITWEAFCDYRMGGTHLSAKGLDVVKRLLAGEKVAQETSGLSKREWRELMAAFGRNE